MKYYPLSRVITGSTLSGVDLYLNGNLYTGPYYKTWDNKYYTGNDPVTGDSQRLEYIELYKNPDEQYNTTYTGGYIRNNQGISQAYNDVKNVGLIDIRAFNSIVSYFPKPTDLDYARGYIYRYFAKKRNENGNITEVTFDVFDSLKKVESDYNYELYHSIEVYWQISGPIKDTVNTSNGIRTSGIEDTNKRIVETKDKIFKGLIEYIGGNYTKFAKVPTG